MSKKKTSFGPNNFCKRHSSHGNDVLLITKFRKELSSRTELLSRTVLELSFRTKLSQLCGQEKGENARKLLLRGRSSFQRRVKNFAQNQNYFHHSRFDSRLLLPTRTVLQIKKNFFPSYQEFSPSIKKSGEKGKNF